jgi:16S rRNA (cytosine967-C5)-methyltransferase
MSKHTASHTDSEAISASSLLSRQHALKQLLAVLKEGQSLSGLQSSADIPSRDIAFSRMLSFGVLRYYHQLQAQLKPLMKKSLKTKDLDVQLVMLMALYQLQHTRVPDYAVVDAAVKQIRKSKKQWAAKMVNAVLRSFIRQQADSPAAEQAFSSDEARYAHPQWIIDRLKEDWPQHWQQILQANNQQAPMTLRVNLQKISRDDYRQALYEQGIEATALIDMPAALVLSEAQNVRQLPGYDDGWFSVQDAGAQLAAQILNPAANSHILDACAAPGGKTAHCFELQPNIELTALDIADSRLQRLRENCQRLGFAPVVLRGDASHPEGWWQGQLFEQILLDVPCSASGVIRRHPDIKHLRRAEDMALLTQTQREILLKSWALLKPGGQLLYATCSVFKAENEQQIEWFLEQQADASLCELPLSADSVDIQPGMAESGRAKLGLQLFPQDKLHDGFYYALLQKSA